MSGAVRAAVAVFVIGLLFIWLIRPIGDACSDLEQLPSGSEGSSAPSFAPPLTRTCTYTTPDGTQARTRYVPVLDLLALLLVAGIVGGAIGLAGPGGRERAPKPARPPKPERAQRSAQPPPAPQPPSTEEEQARRERDTTERERARQEREARRRR